jgi:hypothetical protein
MVIIAVTGHPALCSAKGAGLFSAVQTLLLLIALLVVSRACFAFGWSFVTGRLGINQTSISCASSTLRFECFFFFSLFLVFCIHVSVFLSFGFLCSFFSALCDAFFFFSLSFLVFGLHVLVFFSFFFWCRFF